MATSDDDLQGLLPESMPKDFYRILIVDDEPVARHLLGAIIRAAGFTNLAEAATGEAALGELRAEPTHLVLVDKNLPGLDGIEVLRAGREIRPACEFIVITAYGSLDSAIEAIDLGAYSYVIKPFSDAQVVVRRVAGALARVQIRLENELLVDRLRMLLSELDRAEQEAAVVRKRDTAAVPRASEAELRVQRAVERLGKLADRMARISQRARGSAADVIAKLGTEMSSLAEMLSGDGGPDDPDHDK
jgi:YesN/AraC family two-component response regulator